MLETGREGVEASGEGLDGVGDVEGHTLALACCSVCGCESLDLGGDLGGDSLGNPLLYGVGVELGWLVGSGKGLTRLEGDASSSSFSALPQRPHASASAPSVGV